MARARNIKPGFFKNEDLAECSPLARLLFAGMWCEADRDGRMEDRPRRLKAEYLPYDDCNIESLLCELARHGFIQRYSVDGKSFICIPKFAKHQNPHVREPESAIPAPCEHSASTVLEQCCNCESTEPARLIPDSPSLIPDSPSLIADSTRDESRVHGRRKRRPPAPVSEIVDLYLSNLPELPGVVTITDKRKRHIETVHAGIMESELDNWRGYFQAVARSAFLTGKVKDWRADFDFLIKPETPIKVLEGKYA